MYQHFSYHGASGSVHKIPATFIESNKNQKTFEIVLAAISHQAGARISHVTPKTENTAAGREHHLYLTRPCLYPLKFNILIIQRKLGFYFILPGIIGRMCVCVNAFIRFAKILHT